MGHTITDRFPPHADADILAVTAEHPRQGTMTWERADQGGRRYYRLIPRSGVFTTADNAREIIGYWRERGWVQDHEVPR